MKRLALAIAAVAIASSIFLSACGHQEQQPTANLTKEAYRQQVASELQSLHFQITKLSAQSGPNQELETLLQKQAVALENFAALHTADDQSWQQVKLEMDTALTALKKNYEQAQLTN